MKYFGIVLFSCSVWFLQIHAAYAEAKVLAFSCLSESEDENHSILLEHDQEGIRLISSPSLGAIAVKEISTQVFEFKFKNPGLLGYLRKIDDTWKFLSSDAGLVTTYSCNNFSEPLALLTEYYAATLEINIGELASLTGTDSLNTIGAQKFVDRLISENLRTQNLLDLKTQQFSALELDIKKSLDELVTSTNEKITILTANHNAEISSLGNRLNAALARAASEERKRRKLEEAERIRLEAEAKKLEKERNQLADQAQDLANYKSEFFGRLREILASQEGVKIVGDRFVFSSEVLFEPGAASLSEAGQLEIDKVANILLGVKDSIPDTIEWVIRVDGHTDDIPLSGNSKFRDNWELSQARSLSVVRYMVETLRFPANRMAANGFGEFQPVNAGDTLEARAQNRRIEIKLTER